MSGSLGFECGRSGQRLLRLCQQVRLEPASLGNLNSESVQSLLGKLLGACSSKPWGEIMIRSRPYTSPQQLVAVANEAWFSLKPESWLEVHGAR